MEFPSQIIIFSILDGIELTTPVLGASTDFSKIIHASDLMAAPEDFAIMPHYFFGFPCFSIFIVPNSKLPKIIQ